MKNLVVFVIFSTLISMMLGCETKFSDVMMWIGAVPKNYSNTESTKQMNRRPRSEDTIVPATSAADEKAEVGEDEVFAVREDGTKMTIPQLMELTEATVRTKVRLSYHPLQNGDVVFDAYTANNTTAYCWWQEACRRRSMQPDRMQRGREGCIGHLVCTKNPQRVGTPAELELGETPRPAPEYMDVKGE